MAVPATGDAGLYPLPMAVAPPTAWTIGVLAVPRSSLRFQTKKIRLFFCQDTSEDDSFFVPLFSKARVFASSPESFI